MSFERIGKFKCKNVDYAVSLSADGECGVRLKVLLLNKYMIYKSVEDMYKEWSFYDRDVEYLLGLERYINSLQSEMDKKKKRNIQMMGKEEFDNKVIG